MCDVEVEHAANELATGRHDPASRTEAEHPTAIARGKLAAEEDTAEAQAAEHEDKHAPEESDTGDSRENSGILPFPWRHPHAHRRRAR